MFLKVISSFNSHMSHLIQIPVAAHAHD